MVGEKTRSLLPRQKAKKCRIHEKNKTDSLTGEREIKQEKLKNKTITRERSKKKALC